MKIKQLLAGVLMLAAACVTAQEMPQMPPVPVDEAVRMGKLPNGLTYYVRHNDYPEHRVNFYIAQRVGSIQEEESQRGLAHFLEHMAFNGTENYPGNGVIDYTRTLGVEFGRNLNAYTSTDQTVYNIDDVPSTRQSALDSCLLILRDWSCGLLLEGDEIDKERGVIHEEWRLRSSASQRMLERNLETLYPGSKYGKRMPIGLMSVVDNFKYNEIRDYYHKWYRPDNQAIVVVGDIDVDYMEGKIKEMFGPIPAPAADAAQVVTEPVPDNDEIIVVSDKDKEQQYSIIQLMFKSDPMPREMKGTMAYMLQDYVMDMVSSMLNQRLAEKAQEPDCPFIQAGSGNGAYIMSNSKEAYTIYAMPKEGQTDAALQAIMTEALRVAKHGFTATEYARAKEEYMSQLQKRYDNRSKISNARYGRSYIANYLEGDPIPSMETEYAIMNQIVPMLPVEMINQGVAEMFPQENNENVVVLCFNQEKEGNTYPTVEGLTGAITAARNSNIEAYVDNVKNEPLMTKLPKAGKIKKETKNAKLGYDELILSNGAKVILKKTDFKDNEIRMYAVSKGGSSLYGQKDWANTELFDMAIMQSGLGNFSNQELEKALAGKQASASLSLGTYTESLSGQSTIKDLETMFQLAYLRMTDIRKDDKAYANIMNLLETALKNKGLQPEAAFADSVNVTLNNHTWRYRPFEAECLKDVNYDRIMQIAKERTANAADFTFYFVGSFDNDTIRKHICQYIASLPAKGKKENWVNVDEHPSGTVLNHFTRKMETPKANAQMYWHSSAIPFTIQNSILADMAGEVLSKVYLQKIREDAGAAYSAGASGDVDYEGDKVFSYVMASVPMKPEKAAEALDIMRQEVPAAAQSVDAATLADIKAANLKNYDTMLKENGFWINALRMWDQRGIDIVNGYREAVNAVTPQQVSDFIKKLMASGNKIEVVMMPQE
ncbi:MAG: insulinase family protein [Muribaculaceae bacterium]|nr:insulinase family protein [Muribaculaceae bacterium]